LSGAAADILRILNAKTRSKLLNDFITIILIVLKITIL